MARVGPFLLRGRDRFGLLGVLHALVGAPDFAGHAAFVLHQLSDHVDIALDNRIRTKDQQAASSPMARTTVIPRVAITLSRITSSRPRTAPQAMCAACPAFRNR